MTEPKKSRAPILVLQASVSVALLVALLSSPGFRGNFTSVVLSADPRWLTAGLLLAGSVQILCLIRWRIFLGMTGMNIGFFESAGIFFAGLFCNLFLPGGAGGDVVKIGLLAARGHDAARAALSVVMDHLAGSVPMIVLGASLMAWKHSWLTTSPLVAGLIHAMVIYLCVIALLIAVSVVLSARGIVSRLPARWPGRAKLIELSGVYFQCAIQWPRTLFALLLATLMLGLFFTTYYFSARAYGVDPGMGNFLSLMPTVDILSGMPVSLGGVGVRESVFALLLGTLADVPTGTAIAISLAGYMMSAIWGLPGAFLWLLHRRKP
ncbi:MAG: lysylphosphatidylglycerol synthase transmembrane domain-containing protein [Verrucomicrobiae bacterium]